MASHFHSMDDVINEPERVQFEFFLDEHRAALNGCLDGLTEEQARRRLVPSRTTLLGLVKHAAFVEKVWFDEAFTGRPAVRSASPPPRTNPSSWPTATPSDRSRQPTGRPAPRPGRRQPLLAWRTS